MTTVYMSDNSCVICGATDKFPHKPLSSVGVGSRDLDGRPTHILRSSVYLWIQRCSSCGYCAPEISDGTHADVELLQSPEYREQLENTAFPETANSFMCYSLLMSRSGLPADAAWAAVFAAWICDDNKFPESAIHCRHQAITFFSKARSMAVEFAETPMQEDIYLADLYRRCGDFENALITCNLALKRNPDNHQLDQLYYEKDLIELGDSGIHTIADMDDV